VRARQEEEKRLNHRDTEDTEKRREREEESAP
jgi:hypothetical protein